MFDTILGFSGGLLQQPSLLIFFVLFFLFIIIAYKVVKMLIRAAMIALISGAFPLFSNAFLGTAIPITVGNVLWFATTGVEVYFVYSILVGMGKIADVLSKPFRRGGGKRKEKVIIVEKAKDKDAKKEG